MKENLLITGGTGFIGDHLRQWLEAKYTVSTFERSSGLDMTNGNQVRAAVARQNAVLHFAATAVGRQEMAKHPEAKTLDFQGLQNIVQAAVEQGAFLIYPSSTLAAGEYGALKQRSEALITSTPGLRYTILRLGSVYGPGMPPDSVVSFFLQHPRWGEPLTIFGSGTEQRNFIHIDDVCAVVECVLEKKSIAEGNVFDVGMAPSVSLNELAQLVVEITGSKSPILHTTNATAADQSLNVEKIKETVGWEARISLREGLLKMLNP